MQEVRIKVFREIPLDGNLEPIHDKKVFNCIYIVCDEMEVFLGTVDTVERLSYLVSPSGVVNMYKYEFDNEERAIFNEAFKQTDGVYKFNGKEFSIKGLIQY